MFRVRLLKAAFFSYAISDHHPIATTRKSNQRLKTSQHSFILYRQRHISINALLTQNWSLLYIVNDPGECTYLFITMLLFYPK